MITALIFDFDGVIVDTETPDYATWQEVFRCHGASLDRSLWQGFIGGSIGRFDPIRQLEDLTGEKVDREAIGRRRRQRYLDLVEESPLLPGVRDYMLEAKRLGLKLGVASSSSLDWVEGHLARRRLLKHLDSLKASNHVSNVKPDPELYLASIAQLGVGPGQAMAIEDSANGITAAKKAGLFCVVVPNAMTKDLSIQHADLRLEALSDIPLPALLAKANGTLSA